jgi:phage gp29-like protein
MYRWVENRWYYRSIAGLIPITPGDGRWILHVPGGRMTPWQHGLWRAVGRAYIRKEHALLHKDNWEAKLANPARVAVAPSGAAEEQADDWFRAVLAWGINTVFGMRPGYDVKLIESNGRGFESFNKTIADQNNEMIISIAGQTVTVDGGAGFQNSDIHKSIRADLIKATGDGLAYTVNTQGIPVFIALRFGPDAIESKATVMLWDVTPPKDRNSEATSMVTAANGIKLMSEALQPYGVTLDIAAITTQFGIPVDSDDNGDGIPDTQPTVVGGVLTRPKPQLRSVPAPTDGDDVDIDDEEAA